MSTKLAQGQTLVVEMENSSDEDDIIKIEYDVGESNKLIIMTTYPDDRNRQGIIYSATLDAGDEAVERSDEEKNKVVKEIVCNSCGTKFNLTQGEVDFMTQIFGEKYEDPKRCKHCRSLRMRRRRSSRIKSEPAQE